MVRYKSQFHQSIWPMIKDSGSYIDSDRFFGLNNHLIDWWYSTGQIQWRFCRTGQWQLPGSSSSSVPTLFSKTFLQVKITFGIMPWHQWEIQGICWWTFSFVQGISKSKSIALSIFLVFTMPNWIFWVCKNAEIWNIVYMIWVWPFCFNRNTTSQVKLFYYLSLFSC